MTITILYQLEGLYEKPVIDVPLNGLSWSEVKVVLSLNTEAYLNEKMRDRGCILCFSLDYWNHIWWPQSHSHTNKLFSNVNHSCSYSSFTGGTVFHKHTSLQHLEKK